MEVLFPVPPAVDLVGIARLLGRWARSDLIGGQLFVVINPEEADISSGLR